MPDPSDPAPADETTELDAMIDDLASAARDMASRLRIAESERDKLQAECSRLKDTIASLELRLAFGDIIDPASPLGRMLDCSRGVELGPNTPHPALASILGDIKIADIAAQILKATARPMSCMEMGRAAVAAAVRWDNAETARSHISATLAKEMRKANPRFVQLGRGEIGLTEWTSLEDSHAPH